MPHETHFVAGLGASTAPVFAHRGRQPGAEEPEAHRGVGRGVGRGMGRVVRMKTSGAKSVGLNVTLCYRWRTDEPRFSLPQRSGSGPEMGFRVNPCAFQSAQRSIHALLPAVHHPQSQRSHHPASMRSAKKGIEIYHAG